MHIIIIMIKMQNINEINTFATIHAQFIFSFACDCEGSNCLWGHHCRNITRFLWWEKLKGADAHALFLHAAPFLTIDKLSIELLLPGDIAAMFLVFHKSFMHPNE